MTIVTGALLHDLGKFYRRLLSNVKTKKHQLVGYEILKKIGYPDETSMISLFHHKDDYKNKDLPHEFGKLDKTLQTWIKMITYSDWLSSGERGYSTGDYNEKRPLQSVFSKIATDDESIIKDLIDPINPDDFDLRYLYYRPLYHRDPEELPFIYPVNLSKIKNHSDIVEFVDAEGIIKSFEDEIREGKEISFNVNYILRVIENYFFLIPARTTTEGSDISLADHVKTTAAIAKCIMNHLIDMGLCDESGRPVSKESLDEIDKIIENYKKIPFRLIKVDLSGIQRFIADVSDAKALRMMRSKSMFVDLLLQDISSHIVKRLNLSKANVIYGSGGNVYILSHDLGESMDGVIDEIRRTLDVYSWKFLNGEICFYIDSVTLTGRDLIFDKYDKSGGFPRIHEKFEEVNKKIALQKSRQCESLVKSEAFRKELSGSPKVCFDNSHVKCVICGNYFKPKGTLEKYLLSPDDPNSYACGWCRTLENMHILIHERYTQNSDEKSIPEDYLNIMYRVSDRTPKIHAARGNVVSVEFPFATWIIESIPLEGSEPISVLGNSAINDIETDGIESAFVINRYDPKLFVELVRMIYSRSKHPSVPMHNFDLDIIMIPEYVYSTDQDLLYNKNYIGDKSKAVIRMDVDNLGRIFINGLPKQYRTISRLSTISRMFDYFFKITIPSLLDKNVSDLLRDATIRTSDIDGTLKESIANFYPNVLLEDFFKTKNLPPDRRIVLIYSGGDDLILNGAWFDVLVTAFQIRTLFKIFTGNHPHISLSAGYLMIPRKFPMSISSILTDELLEEAKVLPSKDALTLFEKGSVNTWDEWTRLLNPIMSSAIKIDKDGRVTSSINSNMIEKLLGFLSMIDNEISLNGDRSSTSMVLHKIHWIYYLFGRYTEFIKTSYRDYYNIASLMINYTFNEMDVIKVKVTRAILYMLDRLMRKK